MVRLLKALGDMSLDPDIKDLFQHLFGDMDMFDHLIFKEILIVVDKVEKNLRKIPSSPF